MDEVEVDVEEVGRAVAALRDHVAVPDLLAQCVAHGVPRVLDRYRLLSHYLRRMFCLVEHSVSGVGVIDKALLLVGAAESGPRPLAELDRALALDIRDEATLASVIPEDIAG